MHCLAEAERQIGDEVNRRDNLEHRQLCDGRERVRIELQRARAGPGAADVNVFQSKLYELTDPSCAIDMGNDFDQEIRTTQRSRDSRMV